MPQVPKFVKTRTEQGWLSVAMREGRVDFVHLRRESGRKPLVLLADSVEKGANEAATLAVLKAAGALRDRDLHIRLQTIGGQVPDVELDSAGHGW